MVTLTAIATATVIIKMTEIHAALLNILKCALSGVKAPDLHHFTPDLWESLINLSLEQKVLPLVYDVIYAQIPTTQLRTTVRHQIMVQTMKTDAFLRLYQNWTSVDAYPIVVKGIICRSLYPKPDLRPSSDEDILVDPKQLAKVVNALEQYGLFTTETDPEAYEFPYRCSKNPLYIELHRSLFQPKSESYGHWNALFSDAFESDYYIECFNTRIRTLPPTQHLLYLICHALKHFVHSGFGIRQVCDMTLFASHYGPEIDWNLLLEQCKRIRAERFSASVFEIGRQYLNFNPDKACYPAYWSSIAADPSDLLHDLLCGGVYGTATATRVHSSNMTLDAMIGNAREGGGTSVLRVIFPSANKISGNYPYLNKRPWLLPVAWTHRIFKYGKEMRASGSASALESVQIGNQRVELLRQYGVIK